MLSPCFMALALAALIAAMKLLVASDNCAFRWNWTKLGTATIIKTPATARVINSSIRVKPAWGCRMGAACGLDGSVAKIDASLLPAARLVGACAAFSALRVDSDRPHWRIGKSALGNGKDFNTIA